MGRFASFTATPGPGSRRQKFPEYHGLQLVQSVSGDRPSLVFRRWNHPVHVLTLISSSSARLSAAHGDPRLPNLKRRLPEGKKNQLRRQVATVNNNGLHTTVGQPRLWLTHTDQGCR